MPCQRVDRSHLITEPCTCRPSQHHVRALRRRLAAAHPTDEYRRRLAAARA